MSTENQGVAVELEEVNKAFHPSEILFERLHLQISAGEFVSLVGASGCGKSTLLRILAGLEKADTGSVSLLPAPRTGFVFQEAQLLPWRTVESNVGLPLELTGVSAAERQPLVKQALVQVGMERECTLFPSQLSGGMKMRVSLARALVTNPSLLLLDEPFAALDELNRLHLEEELRRLWSERRMTVVLVTHSFSEAVFLSDRVVILSRQKKGAGEQLEIPLGERTSRLRSDPHFASLVQTCREKFEKLSEAAR